MPTTSSITSNLIHLIRTKPIDPRDLDAAALFVLDALANAVAGRNSTPGAILLRWSASRPPHAATQAFLLGGLTHILETDDLHRASVTHPGCVVVPVAIALGCRDRFTGQETLGAVLHGYEAMCRVGNAVGPAHYRVWHNTATCGPFGSAMAAASLLGLDDGATQHALGNAGTQSSGLWQFLETGAMSKHLHAARAAESGLLAAELAKLGLTGPPEILEGKKGFFVAACPDAAPEKVLAEPAAPWQLTLTSIKPWPSCRHTHPAIDAALELHTRLAAGEISAIEAEVYQAAVDVCDRPVPSNEYEAKFSLQHCIAAALHDGRVDFASFGPDARSGLASLRNRVALRVAEPYRSAYPVHWGARVTVRGTDGRQFSAERVDCKGDPEAPITRADLVAKARMLLRFGGLEEGAIEAFIGSILEMPSGRSDWSAIRNVLC